MKTVKTPKGTELPLIQLKGKDYLQVAHRLQWFNEAADNFDIQTEVIKFESDESVVRAVISVLDKDGKVVRRASATKREDSKGFADHLEKAETGACGRALAMLGYGTQFAVADLDEGSRIVDAPVTNLKTATVAPAATTAAETPTVAQRATTSAFKPSTKSAFVPPVKESVTPKATAAAKPNGAGSNASAKSTMTDWD